LRRTISINHPVKGHNPRILKVPREFLTRVESLPKTQERIFSLQTMNGLFYRQRRSIARKLANPRLAKIMLTTFRDWRLTMIAHRTRDPFQVMATSGHKSMQSIMLYTDVASARLLLTSSVRITRKRRVAGLLVLLVARSIGLLTPAGVFLVFLELMH
jgi:hypothetical protein